MCNSCVIVFAVSFAGSFGSVPPTARIAWSICWPWTCANCGFRAARYRFSRKITSSELAAGRACCVRPLSRPREARRCSRLPDVDDRADVKRALLRRPRCAPRSATAERIGATSLDRHPSAPTALGRTQPFRLTSSERPLSRAERNLHVEIGCFRFCR